MGPSSLIYVILDRHIEHLSQVFDVLIVFFSADFSGSRGETEWSQWVQSEKEQLAAVMEHHGIQWEQKGTHEKHLTVLDYKKQEREKEVQQLDIKIEQKQTEYNVLSKRVENYDSCIEELDALEKDLNAGDKYQLPEPQGFMTAKAYKSKIAEPLVEKLKSMLKAVLVRAFKGWDNYYRLNMKNGTLYQENQELSKVNKKLAEENMILRNENKDFKLLRRVFGRRQIDDLVEQARFAKSMKRDNVRFR